MGREGNQHGAAMKRVARGLGIAYILVVCPVLLFFGFGAESPFDVANPVVAGIALLPAIGLLHYGFKPDVPKA